MRLREEEAVAIVSAARAHFGEGTRVWLFGSRADDRKRGGDIDLLIAPAEPLSPADALSRKIRFLTDLERAIGEGKVDVVVESRADDRPIVRIARETGIPL